MQELIRNIIRVKEQLEADAQARQKAEAYLIHVLQDNERLTTEIQKLLKEKEDDQKELTRLRAELDAANSAYTDDRGQAAGN